jgi:hypothetical protein
LTAIALASSLLQRSAAERDLVSIGVVVRALAHAVRVGFPLHGIASPLGCLRYKRIEIIDQEQVHSMATVLRPVHNIHIPVLRKLPHSLCIVWKKCGWETQQPFVPHQRFCLVGDWDSRKQVKIRGVNHSYFSILDRSCFIVRAIYLVDLHGLVCSAGHLFHPPPGEVADQQAQHGESHRGDQRALPPKRQTSSDAEQQADYYSPADNQ